MSGIDINPEWPLKRQIKVALKLGMDETVCELLPQVDFRTSLSIFLSTDHMPPLLWLGWSRDDGEYPDSYSWRFAGMATRVIARGEYAIIVNPSGGAAVIHPSRGEWENINSNRPGRIAALMGKEHMLSEGSDSWEGPAILLSSPNPSDQEFTLATARLDYLVEEVKLMQGMALASQLGDSPELERMTLELEKIWNDMKIQLSYIRDLSSISREIELERNQSSLEAQAQRWISENS